MRRIYHYHTIDFIVALNESKMKFPRFLKVLSHSMILELSYEYMIKILFLNAISIGGSIEKMRTYMKHLRVGN